MPRTCLILVCFFFLACHQDNNSNTTQASAEPVATNTTTQAIQIDTSGQTISTRFAPPEGFVRESLSQGTFGYFLRHFPLKSAERKVMLFDGREKLRQNVHAAVLDIDVGTRDLQQCADAVMRLRAEYFWQNENFNAISFNFTNGFPATYARWRNGERIRVSGNSVTWTASRRADYSYAAFRKYLTMVFSYAGTLSLDKELHSKPLSEIVIGDVFIQGGSPGHAIIVVDKAVHPETKEVLIMLAQSYMPAQDIHVLRNGNNTVISPWYKVSDISPQLRTPEWVFEAEDLKGW